MLLRARTLLPVGTDPIEDGGLWIESGRIVEIGPWSQVQQSGRGSVIDLGEVLVHPGWVNAHCHLDLTDLAGVIAPPRSFSDWIKALLGARSGWSFSEFAASWIRGARQLIHTGTTTVANIEFAPEILSDVRAATPLRVWSLLEFTGVRSRRDPREVVESGVQSLESLPAAPGGLGLSPHAPYSTSPTLMSVAARAARDRDWLVATHIAESTEEFEMYVERKGALHDWLASQRPMTDCGLGTPVAHCARQDLLSPRFLAIHANALADEDIGLLAQSGASVVYCPQSHDYFQHPRFRFSELRAAGINVCLGTDSLASTRKLGRTCPTLSMKDELRNFRQRHPDIAPRELIQLATVCGARAMRLPGLAGELSAGAWADLAMIPYAGTLADAEAALVEHPGESAGTMIAGHWVWLDHVMSPRLAQHE